MAQQMAIFYDVKFCTTASWTVIGGGEVNEL